MGIGKAIARAAKSESRQERFDLTALRAIVGETVFARGQAYHREGRVEILAADSRRVLARVSGTEEYRVELSGQGTMLRMACSCRAFEDRGPCKHIVAAALAANAHRAETPDPFERIRAFLETQSVKALADLLVECAEMDASLFKKLDLAAATAGGDDAEVERRLRQALENATRVRGFIEYAEVGGWASHVADVLNAISSLVAGRAAVALDLAERAIDQIEEAIEHIDDSDGLCGSLLIQARDIHLAAACSVRPEPVRFARDLFEREMEQGYDTFDDAARIYAAVLGEAGREEYRRLAQLGWAKVPNRNGAQALYAFDHAHYRLFNILDGFADLDGDIEARIALREKDLSSPYQYLQLAEFCRSNGRRDEALRRAEEGLWMFEDSRSDERLVVFASDLMADVGRRSDAAALLERSFGKSPSLELYQRLRKIGGKAVRDRLITTLEARLAKGDASRGSLADLLVDILTTEHMFDAAWAALERYGASAHNKVALANASATTHPVEAVIVYAGRVDALVELGGNQSYADAVDFVRRLNGLQDPEAHRAYLADLKLRFGRKRNFMKLLTEAEARRTSR